MQLRVISGRPVNSGVAWVIGIILGLRHKMNLRPDRRIKMSTKLTPEIIAAAIEGFEIQKARIDEQIAELRAMLNGRQPTAAAAPQTTKRSTMSAAGRKRIAEAQRKRWAVIRGASESAAAQPPKRRRRLSAAGRAAIVDALKKRWAEKRAAGARPQPVAAKKAAPKKMGNRKAA